MNARNLLVILAMLFIAGAARLPAAEPVDDSPVFDVPKLDGIAIDGNPADWGERGFRVDVLTDAAGKVKSAADFSPSFRLGWNERGLLVLVTVVDDTPFETPENKVELWKGDSVEFFVATSRGSNDSYQVVVSPGRDLRHAELEYNTSDYRNSDGNKSPLKVTLARTVTPNGYIIEALLPWKNLNIAPKEGTELAFQLYANDSDKEGERYQALWYPRAETNNDTHNACRIRLADHASSTVAVSIRGGYDTAGRAQLSVVAPGYLCGKRVKVKDCCKTVAREKLKLEGDWAVARFNLAEPLHEQYGPLGVSVNGDPANTVVLPAPSK